MKAIEVKFKKLCPEAEIPQKAHPEDIGFDVKAVRVEYDAETDCYKYYTGLSWEAEAGISCFGFAQSRNSRTDCYLTNHVGIIDPNYRGEIQFRYKNRTSRDMRVESYFNLLWSDRTLWERILCTFSKFRRYCLYSDMHQAAETFVDSIIMDYAPYKVGESVGQFVIMEVPDVSITEVEEINETDRGEGGFGSTAGEKQ